MKPINSAMASETVPMARMSSSAKRMSKVNRYQILLFIERIETISSICRLETTLPGQTRSPVIIPIIMWVLGMCLKEPSTGGSTLSGFVRKQAFQLWTDLFT